MQEIIPIDSHTYRLEDGGVRFFLLLGSEKALLIDSGMQSPDAKAIAESLTSLPLSLLNTHADPDHISGNATFDTFYMHPSEEENYKTHGGTGTWIPVRDGDVLDLGNRPLRIFHLPGHTPGSIAILDEKARVLYGGDAIQDGNIFMFGDRRNLADYIESLSGFYHRHENDFDTVYPSHGSIPISGKCIPDILSDAKDVLSKKCPGTPTSFMGRNILVCKGKFATFLYE